MTSGRPTILFVDDESNILNALRRVFIDDDYELHFAGSAADGLIILQNEPIDLVVSDVRMPVMDGIEFLARVKDIYPSIARILLSGYAEKASVIEALSSGCAQQILAKPWDDHELKDVIHGAINQLSQQKNSSESMQALINSLVNLPPLPQIYHELRVCLADRNTYTIDQVEAIVGQDAAISADLLRWANSALFGQRGKVDSLKRAILLLGTDVVESLVLSMSIERNVGSIDMEFDHKRLQQHAMGCAVVARLLAQEDADASPELADQVFIAGLLHDVGVLAGNGIFTEAYARIAQLAEKKPLLLAEAELEVLHSSHPEIGAIIANWWTLPKFITSAIRWHLEPEKATENKRVVEIVAVANVLSYEFGFGISDKFLPPVVPAELRERYGLTPENIEVLRDKAHRSL